MLESCGENFGGFTTSSEGSNEILALEVHLQVLEEIEISLGSLIHVLVDFFGMD